MKMPTLPKHHSSDDNVYLVNTKKHGVLVCTTTIDLNEDGVTISMTNDVVFKSIDPLSNLDERYQPNNIYKAEDILSWELLERKMPEQTPTIETFGVADYLCKRDGEKPFIQGVDLNGWESADEFLEQLATEENKGKSIQLIARLIP